MTPSHRVAFAILSTLEQFLAESGCPLTPEQSVAMTEARNEFGRQAALVMGESA